MHEPFCGSQRPSVDEPRLSHPSSMLQLQLHQHQVPILAIAFENVHFRPLSSTVVVDLSSDLDLVTRHTSPTLWSHLVPIKSATSLAANHASDLSDIHLRDVRVPLVYCFGKTFSCGVQLSFQWRCVIHLPSLPRSPDAPLHLATTHEQSQPAYDHSHDSAPLVPKFS